MDDRRRLVMRSHDRAVAFAGALLETAPIEDAHLAVPLPNAAGILQLRRRVRHALTRRAELRGRHRHTLKRLSSTPT